MIIAIKSKEGKHINIRFVKVPFLFENNNYISMILKEELEKIFK